MLVFDPCQLCGGVSVLSLAVAPQAGCWWPDRWLQVLGPGAAPAVPRLHARLAPPPLDAVCRWTADRHLWNEDKLRLCHYLDGIETNATLYLLRDEWAREAEALLEELRDARVSVRRVTRHELERKVVAGEPRSFLFFDAELWSAAADVVSPAPPAPTSLLLGTRLTLMEHAPALYVLLRNGTFAPSASDLQTVLAAPDDQLEQRACEHLPAVREHRDWVRAASTQSERRAYAMFCNSTDEMYKRYVKAFKILPYHLNVTTGLTKLKAMFLVDAVAVNCSHPYALCDKLTEWHSNGIAWRAVGVVAPAELVRACATDAARFRLPLLTYTPAPAEATSPAVRAATGSAEQLAAALLRLLAACEWGRLGVLSDGTPLARAVTDALARRNLLVKEVDASEPALALKTLFELGTRIFFVNCEADAAARVLASMINSSWPGDEHVWILRDYEAPDAATARLGPLSVTFQWRGGEEFDHRWNDTELLRMTHYGLFNLTPAWRDDPWPRYAGAALDALLALATGFERLVRRHREVLDDPLMENKLSYFWDELKNGSFPGILSELKYDDLGVVNACVYVERWGTERRPRRLAAWGACGETARVLDRCPVAASDGRSRCVVRAGPPFNPNCYDGAVLGGAAAVTAALLALWWAAAALRQWLARRDRRLERATTAKILAQREAAFAELAEHLVARDELKLGQELGAGRFGRVWRGELLAHASSSRRRPVTVAVKTLREDASPMEESQFLREARLLAALEHEHVVRFRGVCWEGGPPLLLMELALFGDLQQYLRARRHLAEGAGGAAGETEPEEAAAVSSTALTRLASEAAAALAYLAARGLVHRDVRAANCLVDARRSLKLADFGLARETGTADGEYACHGRALFPVLWMAPESLARGVATAASDVWSFGVLALELVTLGARPFGDAPPEAVVHAVLAGGRPPLPRDACAETRALTLACWRRAPAERPRAARLAAWLARRPTALRPALAPDLEEPDCDSGIGEPEYDPTAPSAPTARLSVSLLTLITQRNI